MGGPLDNACPSSILESSKSPKLGDTCFGDVTKDVVIVIKSFMQCSGMSTPSILKKDGSTSKAKKVSFGVPTSKKSSINRAGLGEMSSKSGKKRKRCASSREKLNGSSTESKASAAVTEDQDEPEYEVEAILAHKKVCAHLRPCR